MYTRTVYTRAVYCGVYTLTVSCSVFTRVMYKGVYCLCMYTRLWCAHVSHLTNQAMRFYCYSSKSISVEMSQVSDVTSSVPYTLYTLNSVKLPN
jgi:hypothetical protein